MAVAGAHRGSFDDAECDRLFSCFRRLPAIGVAVSGGPDSTALLLLLDHWSRLCGGPELYVLTVDHGLRAAAAGEAEAVLALAARLGRPAEKLLWHHDGAPPVADLQARARDARYRLLAAAAGRRGLSALALAHTLDDQAETFMMRLARGSGVRGLAAMAAERTAHGVRFVRPLIDVEKSRLLAFLEARGEPYVTDPSNAADRFLRARVRKLMPALADAGLGARRLADTARRMARAEAALAATTAALRAGIARDHGGVFSVDTGGLSDAPDELALRLLADLVGSVRPRPYPPRAAAFEHWLDAFRAKEAPRRATMAGVVLDCRSDRLWLYAESGRVGFPHVRIDADGTYCWDDRFAVTVDGLAGTPLVIAAATGEHRRRDLPPTAAGSLPAARTVDGEMPPPGVSVRIAPLDVPAGDDEDERNP